MKSLQGIIVFWSKYGSAKQYAQWLHDETGFHVRSAKRPFGKSLKKADIVIAGSPVRGGKMKIAQWIRRRWPEICTKNVIIFSTSVLSPEDPAVHDFWLKNFPENIREKCHFFALPGRLVYSKLSFRDKIILRISVFMQNDKEVRDGLLKGFDAVERAALDPLLKHLRALEKPAKKINA